MSEFKCQDCDQPCEPEEETFDYAGTHCTNGRLGVHHTGHYVSDCCGAVLVNNFDSFEEEEQR